VGDLGAAFLCADLGLTPVVRDDHVAYLEHWIAILKEDRRALFSAAAHASRALEYLHSLQPQAQIETAAA
jgi:antirestriction protein ArdC